MSKNKARQYENEVQKSLDFTDEDLALNREGYLSEAQEAEQRQRLTVDMRVMLLPALTGLICVMWASLNTDRFYLVLIIILLGIGSFAAFQMREAYVKSLMRKRPVQRAEVQLKPSIYSNTTAVFNFENMEKSILVSPSLYMSLQGDEGKEVQWAIYYLPNPFRVLSAERLSDEPVKHKRSL